MEPRESSNRPGDLLRRGRLFVRRIATERTSAAGAGWAVATGIVIGTTPFWGFHLPLCIAVATLLRLNRPLTYLAANISIPPAVPFLLFASVQIGTWIESGETLPLSFASFQVLNPYDFFRAWLIGGLVVGTGLAVPAGLLAFAATYLYRRRHPMAPDPIGDAMTATAARYAPQSRWTAAWIAGRLQHDPFYRELAQRLPLSSPVVDVACASGQAGLLIHHLAGDLEVLGVDRDPRKIARAQRAAQGCRGVRFIKGDWRSLEVPPAGTLVLRDVLQHHAAAAQDALLHRAAEGVRAGGMLIIRTVDPDTGVRFFFTKGWEQARCVLQLRRPRHLFYRPIEQIAGVLAASGLRVTAVDAAQDALLAHVSIVAHRPEPGANAADRG